MMNDVFISYSRKDKPFVQKLDDALHRQQQETWVDWDDIEYTEDWWQAIERGIEGANTCVFVISPDSVASQHCHAEIDHAVKHHKRLVPIIYREVVVTQVHPELRKLNWVYFRDTDPFDRTLAGLLKTIQTDLEYVRAHTRILERAIEWNNQKRNASYLLQGENLETAKTWLLKGASKQPQPTELQVAYLEASLKAEIVQRRNQRLAVTTTLAVVAAAILVPLTQAATILSNLRQRSNVVFAQPGQSIPGSTKYRLTYNNAMMEDYARGGRSAIINQIVFGIPHKNESTDCIDVGIIQNPQDRGDKLGEHPVRLSAPQKAGVYYVHFGLEQQFDCNSDARATNAKTFWQQNKWKEDPAKDEGQGASHSEQPVIGVVIVGNPIDIAFHWSEIQTAFNKDVPDQATQFGHTDKGTAYASLTDFSFQK